MASHFIKSCRQRAEAAFSSLQRIGSQRHSRSDPASDANQEICKNETPKKFKRKKFRKRSIERPATSEATKSTSQDCMLASGERLGEQSTHPLPLKRDDSLPERVERYHTTEYEPVHIDRRSTLEEDVSYSKSQEAPNSSSLHQSPSQGKERAAETPSDTDANSTVDYTTHYRPAVCHETIRPQQHTIYHPERTKSVHLHEHYYYIQPIEPTSAEAEPSEPRLQ
jgi:hypothetical protein